MVHPFAFLAQPSVIGQRLHPRARRRHQRRWPELQAGKAIYRRQPIQATAQFVMQAVQVAQARHRRQRDAEIRGLLNRLLQPVRHRRFHKPAFPRLDRQRCYLTPQRRRRPSCDPRVRHQAQHVARDDRQMSHLAQEVPVMTAIAQHQPLG